MEGCTDEAWPGVVFDCFWLVGGVDGAGGVGVWCLVVQTAQIALCRTKVPLPRPAVPMPSRAACPLHLDAPRPPRPLPREGWRHRRGGGLGGARAVRAGACQTPVQSMVADLAAGGRESPARAR